MRTEIWRTPIHKGEVFDNYQVSNLGQILSLNFRNTGKPELMNPWEDKDGYLKIGLRNNRKTDFILVHRLIAETFIPNPDNLPQVNHKIDTKEGKKINMVIFNEDGTVNKERTTIEWVTSKENNDYGTRNERVAKANTNGIRSKPVLQLSLTGDLIREWPSVGECGRNGFNKGAVAACCRGEKPQYKGFRWEYK